ncbi:MAG: DDE-type integrase/transposase/recombinase [Parcubacteria group bacterium]|nr:DDE-type integrase/transposase/recombinase [Parcubacteria group bacterium]
MKHQKKKKPTAHWTVFFRAACLLVFPFPITFVLTDNGSEFKKHFDIALRELHLTHYHTYPRTPKMNAHIERFNRTIQEEFAMYHDGLLLLSTDRFNMFLLQQTTQNLVNQKGLKNQVFFNSQKNTLIKL